jgi:RND family efflux transporter MFP subunit
MNANAVRNPVLILLVATMLAAVLVWLKPEPETVVPEPRPLLVDVLEVQEQTLSIRVRAQGIVQPGAHTSLVSEVSGRIVEVSDNFNAGGFFRAGEVLLRIDPRDYQARLQQAEALVAQARSALAQERGRVEVAQREWQQRSGRGKVSEQARQLAQRKPQLLEAEAQLASAQAGLGQARLDLERTAIVAPYDGLVSDMSVDIGQFVAAGSPMGAIMAVAEAEIRLAIPESKLGYLSLPNKYGELTSKRQTVIELSHTLGDDRSRWQATLERTEGVLDQRSRSLFLVARVRDPYGIYRANEQDGFTPLRFGMFVDASIEGRRVEDVISLPRSVIRPGNLVWIVDDDNRLQERKVDLLRTDGAEIFVTEGLAQGDKVCLTSVGPVLPGTLVSISSVLRQNNPGIRETEMPNSDLVNQSKDEPKDALLRPDSAAPMAPAA